MTLLNMFFYIFWIFHHWKCSAYAINLKNSNSIFGFSIKFYTHSSISYKNAKNFTWYQTLTRCDQHQISLFKKKILLFIFWVCLQFQKKKKCLTPSRHTTNSNFLPKLLSAANLSFLKFGCRWRFMRQIFHQVCSHYGDLRNSIGRTLTNIKMD